MSSMSINDVAAVLVSHRYNVCPESIFDAWLEPEIIRKWLFVGPSSEITHIEMNPKVRGRFSILELERSNGEYIDHYGTYQEIDRPSRLVFTLSVPKHFQGETCVTIEIKTKSEGCELTLTQTGVAPDTTESNWRDMLRQLDVAIDSMRL